MAMTEVPPEVDYLNLPLRERRRRLEERNGATGDEPELYTKNVYTEDVGLLADEEPRIADAVSDSPAPACSVCGRPARRGAKTCAEPQCASEARRRREAAVRQRRAETPSARPAPTNGTAMAAGPAERLEAPDGQPEAANGKSPADLGPIYRALMLAGARLVRADVTVASETWRIERVPPERTAHEPGS